MKFLKPLSIANRYSTTRISYFKYLLKHSCFNELLHICSYFDKSRALRVCKTKRIDKKRKT